MNNQLDVSFDRERSTALVVGLPNPRPNIPIAYYTIPIIRSEERESNWKRTIILPRGGWIDGWLDGWWGERRKCPIYLCSVARRGNP